MKRRDFITTGLVTAFAGAVTPGVVYGNTSRDYTKLKGKAKNIIFLVSDGMSNGTLNMADLLLQRKEGHGSAWIDLYRENRASRALMDTASADSIVTDSAAASAAWGGGKRVKNGALNINLDGSANKPILQKFKDAGKSVGCVTTVPITHATPAGFTVSVRHRNMQGLIASEYLKLRFDVMMGGGMEYFDGTKRMDKKNIFGDFEVNGFQVVKTKADMQKAVPGKPLLGVFYNDGLPYDLDLEQDAELKEKIPTLLDMTQKSLSLLADNPNGFVLQIEGGKVDWAAHANDATALLYEQIAFDRAIAEAIKFAENRDDTLVIITTDHGNSNPGLIKNDKVEAKFDTLQTAKHTNDWVLRGVAKDTGIAEVIERFKYAQGITITKEEAEIIAAGYNPLSDKDLYNPYKLPFENLANIQKNYTSVYWSGMNHSADFVELTMFGPGSEALPPFVKNYELHNFMLAATGLLDE